MLAVTYNIPFPIIPFKRASVILHTSHQSFIGIYEQRSYDSGKPDDVEETGEDIQVDLPRGVEKGVVCVLTNKIRTYLAGRDIWRMDTTASVPHIVNVFGESEEAVFFFILSVNTILLTSDAYALHQ